MKTMMKVGVAADHGGNELKQFLIASLQATGFDVVDFGSQLVVVEDDRAAFILPLAWAVARGEVTRGLAICGCGLRAAVAADLVPGVRAALTTNPRLNPSRADDEARYVRCLGGQVTGQFRPLDVVCLYLDAVPEVKENRDQEAVRPHSWLGRLDDKVGIS